MLTSRLHFAIGLLSSTLIAYQLVLMHLLAVVQWHHYAYMVISVALLGFGASGTLLAVFREWTQRHSERLVPLFMIGSGIAMAVVIGISRRLETPFDAALLEIDAAQVWALFWSYLLYLIPFLLGALAIGLVLIQEARHVGTYYFANLIGSGLGGPLAIGLLWLLPSVYLPAIVAVGAIAAGLIVLPRTGRWPVLAAGAASLVLAAYCIVDPVRLELSPYKSIYRATAMPDAHIVLENSSPYGLLQVVAWRETRRDSGLAEVRYADATPRLAVYNNGNLLGRVPTWTRDDTLHVHDSTTAALPYEMRRRDRVLVLDAGTGEAVAHAVSRGVPQVVAVEPHTHLVDLLRHELAGATDSLYYQPSVEVLETAPRNYLARTTTWFDLIEVPWQGAPGEAEGIYALEEYYTLTREGVLEMWNRLSPDGVLAVTVWLDDEYRYALRMMATLVDLLDRAGVTDPSEYMAAVRGDRIVTFVVKSTQLTPSEVQAVRRFSERHRYDPLILPGLRPEERHQNQVLRDDRLFWYTDILLTSGRKAMLQDFPYDITPVHDDRPYAAQFVRFRDLIRFPSEHVEKAEVGYRVVWVTLVQVLVAALLLILVPLVRRWTERGGRMWTMWYFGGIGLGYLFVEIVFIHRFTLYLGHPLYAAAAVLAILLVFSGLGSYISERFLVRRMTLRHITGAVALLVGVYTLVLAPLQAITMHWPLASRALFSFFLIAPTAFVMGMPFPLGVRYLVLTHENLVPWAWGISGVMSVISAVLATIIAVEAGFTVVLASAVGVYVAVALSIFPERGPA